MALKNTSDSYGWLAKSFHWLVALLIITLLVVGNIMTGMENNPFKFKIYGIHKATGMLVLALVVARLCWRQMNIEPGLSHIKPWQRLAATGVHMLLYVCMFVMPISGWAMSSAGGHPISFYGLFTVPPLVEKNADLGKLLGTMHWAIGWTIVALLCAHVGAALLHHFYYKDNILKRMLP